jgi:hypothetical protein
MVKAALRILTGTVAAFQRAATVSARLRLLQHELDIYAYREMQNDGIKFLVTHSPASAFRTCPASGGGSTCRRAKPALKDTGAEALSHGGAFSADGAMAPRLCIAARWTECPHHARSTLRCPAAGRVSTGNSGGRAGVCPETPL